LGLLSTGSAYGTLVSVGTPTSEKMNSVVDAIHPLLKQLGYRKRRNTFNRWVDSRELVHVVNFQMASFSPPGTVELPGIRPNLYGRFTLNLGVHLVGVPTPGFDQADDPSFLAEYRCHIRCRIGALLNGHDTWWSLQQPFDEVVVTISEALTSKGLPWLAQYDSWDDTLVRLEGTPDPSNNKGFMSAPRLTAMGMRLARGELAEAEQDFVEHVMAAQAAGRSPSHMEYLAQLAHRHGL
jgi:hypothetical protein